jgi:hypothetical protein
MKNRKSVYLFMCMAECIRAGLVFSGFVPLLGQDTVQARMLAAMVASPSLLLPLMWFFLWYDRAAVKGFGNLIVAGKSLSALSDLAWMAAFFAELARTWSIDPRAALKTGAAWGIIVILDVALAATSFALSRSLDQEEN